MGSRVVRSYIKFEFEEFDYVTRKAWGARPPMADYPMDMPSSIIAIYYTNTPPCHSREECERTLREVQADHMDNRNHIDIKHNFFIGADGVVYEGRGWGARGMNMPLMDGAFLSVNQNIVDIAFIGSYEDVCNSYIMRKTFSNFVNYWRWRENITVIPFFIFTEGQDFLHMEGGLEIPLVMFK